MAQFDVYRTAHGDLVIDCQAEAWSAYNTRFVAPLFAPNDKLPRVDRLNPIFDIDGEPMVMMTEFAAAIPTRELRRTGTSLADHDLTIKSALDMLVQGH
jgi:toxin CcdB